MTVFYGSVNPKTQQSWCPDCNDAEPQIKSMLKAKEAEYPGEVLYGMVELKEWRSTDPLHPYRKLPFQVTSVPTVLFWHGDKIVDRI